MFGRWQKRESQHTPDSTIAGVGREPLIQLNQVVKVYETGARSYMALRGVDVRIERGEFVAIVGKSGSGKSTLVNMITGIDRPTSGEIIIGGTAVHALDEERMAEWRGRTVGVVFQFFQLLPLLTAAENVILPMDFCNFYQQRERRRRAIALLDLVEMADYADKLPATLSGGEQQRVAIARALANDPPILVADEPTGNLDSATAETVFQLFERVVAEGKTVVMVTHDQDLAQRAHRTLLIADGQIVQDIVRPVSIPVLRPDSALAASSVADVRRVDG